MDWNPKRTGDRSPRAMRRGRPGVRLALALGAVLALGAASAAGCGQTSTDGTGGAAEGPAAEAKQAIVSPQVCTTIRRQGTSGSVADAHIMVNSGQNFGASGTMVVGTFSGQERQALLQFDLSAIPSGAGTTITSATLNLSDGVAAPSGPGTIEVHRVTAPWSESSVSWLSFNGAFDPTISASFSNASQLPSVDIQSLVQGWVRGAFPNDGLLLKQPGAYSTNLWTSEYQTVSLRPSLSVCYTVGCSPGFADCNGVGADGCETDLTSSPANCGACGSACSVPNATAACTSGACAVGSCNLGFADCDGNAANGCETRMTTNTDCGGCGVPCALPNGAASCSTGTCTLASCNAGFFDCDGNPANGCEALPCANGSHCATGAGCTSGVCANGVCAAPGCSDGVKNGSETATDCGGSCPPCPAGQTCVTGADCASGMCNAGACAAPSCADGVKNGAETAVDCGGGSCPACASGQGCALGSDCASGVCTAGLCQAAACNDGIQNGAETSVDCGGGACPACPAGKACTAGADCVDQVCQNGVCQLPSCSDGVKNGSETDVDCGGPCAPCVAQDKCATDADCVSGVCRGGVCQAPTCTDGVKNGNETGVDCGGACYVPETCNGKDDDCNGLVDDGLGSTTCGIGACQVTVQNCVGGQVQTCTPLAPQPEQCDGLIDDDCDGVVDNGCSCVDGHTQSCYTGAPSTLGVGLCQAGTQTCVHGQWGACAGEIIPTAETCDGQDNDCNGQVDDGLGQTVCGVGGCQVTQPNCVNGQPQTCTPHAPQPETCDGVDNDCNGVVDDGLPTLTCGVGACKSTVPSCVNGQAQACTPGAPSAEACDGIDNDCNGAIDDGNPGGGKPCNTGKLGVCAAGTTQCTAGGIVCVQNVQPSAETCDGLDNDCDGVVDNGNPGAGAACSTGKPGICAAGTTVCSGGTLSCQQSRQPQAESCNGLDDDCDGVVDNGNPGGGQSCNTGKLGVCAAGTTACAAGAIVCNENVQPSSEVCDGRLDENCNGQVDEGCSCVNGQTQGCYTGAANTQNVGACHGGTQTCVNGQWGACVGQVLPSAEVCDGLDNNCNGQVDDGLGTISCGVGQCGRTVAACTNGHANTCTPGAPQAETCNGLDDDCDGVVDDGNPGGGAACNTGKLGICAAGTTVCVSGALACNQNQGARAETCNGLDDNCNGQVDEGLLGTYYRDADGDGYGTSSVTTQACSQPAGYASNASDCNDGNASIHPGAAEVCNGLDDNCNGQVDEGGSLCSGGVCSGGSCHSTCSTLTQGQWPADSLLGVSGYISASSAAQCQTYCNTFSNTLCCMWSQGSTYQGVTSPCFAFPDAACRSNWQSVTPASPNWSTSTNFWGTICSCPSTHSFCRDADGDGYGTSSTTTQACSVPPGYSDVCTDCNDSRSATHPGAAETCNGIDDNCNGQVDEGFTTLRAGQSLSVGQSVTSCDGRFVLTLQSNGNLVLTWNGVGTLWSSGTTGTGANQATMQSDGNFVLYASGVARWSSNTAGNAGAYLAVQNDGNVVVYSSGGTPLWNTQTGGH